MDNPLKLGFIALAGLAVVGIGIMIKNRSSTSDDAQEPDNSAPAQESEDLPGMESESPVGGKRKTKRKSKRKKSKRGK